MASQGGFVDRVHKRFPRITPMKFGWLEAWELRLSVSRVKLGPAN